MVLGFCGITHLFFPFFIKYILSRCCHVNRHQIGSHGFVVKKLSDLYEDKKKGQYEVKSKKALCGNRSINVDQFCG
jgi:hypothetical protein